jgi:hypothetical protein
MSVLGATFLQPNPAVKRDAAKARRPLALRYVAGKS